MVFLDQFMEKWNAFIQRVRPFFQKTTRVFKRIGSVMHIIWDQLVKFRKIFMAAPVAWAAFSLGAYNMQNLPDTVGLNLQENGAFGLQLAKELAVLGPIALTAFCLLLMFCSRRTLTPWMVSIISLAIPVIILLTNVFPS